MTKVAEIVTFRLAEGISTEAYVKLSQSTEAFVRSHDGFVHRQLSRGEDGLWTDYVVWTDMETAQRVAASFAEQEFAGALMQAIDPASMNMRHAHIHWNMAA